MKIFLQLAMFFICIFLFLTNTYADKYAHVDKNNDEKFSWYIDHVVIVVNNLSKATQDFTKLGFTVILGGDPGGNFDRNALIPFSDGSYIELFAPIQPSMMSQLEVLKSQNKLASFTSHMNAIDSRFVDHVASGEGLADFAISAANLNLNQEIAILHQRGLFLAGPTSMERTRPDKQKVIWKVAVPRTNSLPFLITDVTSRSLRVGGKKPFVQKNGVVGVASIIIAVSDILKSSKEYRSLLGIPPVARVNFFIPKSKISVFKVGNVNIILVQPIDKKSPLYNHLITHGEGPYSLSLYTKDSSMTGKLNSFLTHKADINLIKEARQ